MILQHTEASGTNGGATVAATWTKLPINTEAKNTIAGASLATNVITLPAGEYLVEGDATIFKCFRGKCRLRDTTNTEDLIIGRSAYSFNGNGGDTVSKISGEIILASTSTIEYQYYAENAIAGNGLGVATTSGIDELYSQLTITKI